ncbi:MAG: UDP-2,4-diacetamido-2,4,6-trideoxy-beta-L-altropyranose hydrolase [Alphaproteobacteria bacterium]|nr:UDP-2,4-diacetamido-2,4,6-trideoxy-beta-L-altropyranose hydrolase [Alphaproteobacteria bacterium]
MKQNSISGPSRRVIFRCDGGIGLGYGHIARCQTLARALSSAGWACEFAVSGETAKLAMWNRSSFPLLVLDEPHDPACLVKLIDVASDLVVIDHYELDARYEDAMRNVAATRFVFEDTPGRYHNAEILLDAAHGRSAEAYQDLVSGTCRLLLGSDYVLLAPELHEKRQDILTGQKVSEDVSNVFVCFGGMDGNKFVIDALRALDLVDQQLSVDVAIGAGARHLPEILDLAEISHQDVTIHQDCSYVADLLANADIALGAGGVNAWERCFLGVPSIVACAAENQLDLCNTVVNHGVALGVVEPGIGATAAMHELLGTLLEDTLLRQNMSNAALHFCNGMGARNIVSAIEETVSQNAI